MVGEVLKGRSGDEQEAEWSQLGQSPPAGHFYTAAGELGAHKKQRFNSKTTVHSTHTDLQGAGFFFF